MCVSVCVGEGSRGSQGLDQVQFVSLLTGEDGSLFVVFNKLFHRVELTLSNAVKVFLQLHFEMLVLALRLQGDGEVMWLWKERVIQGFIISGHTGAFRPKAICDFLNVTPCMMTQTIQLGQ